MSERLKIAEELLGAAIAPGGFAPCPGKARHTKPGGPKDFKVIMDGAPTGFCFHSSCSEEVATFNKELRRRIWFAENPRHAGTAWHERARAEEVRKDWGVAEEPMAATEPKPALNLEAIEEFIRGVAPVDGEFLRRRSPVDVAGLTSADFLEMVFEHGEMALVFTDKCSQGDYLYWCGKGGYRLSKTQGVKAVKSALASTGRDGVLFLSNPVNGQWMINPNSVKGGGEAKWSRRSEANVTRWKYFVLESDEVEEAKWLRVLGNAKLPIVAIYTSGRRSVHALVRCEVESKSAWDATRNILRQYVCPLGADPAALTAVRLTRLPGCMRNGQMQRLLYLDRAPDSGAIWLKPELRE